MTQVRQSRRSVVGTVIGTKMNKTIVVRVETLQKHAKYGKYMRHRKKYYAHDENETAGIGDQVSIVSCRPLSKLKRWRLETIVQAAPERGADVAAIAAAGAEDVLASKKQKKEQLAEGGAS
ncbi:MAG: 30S ribosomal protein S17 [Planctomycetes bacterium]|nr:30S ribosomal protein S17 [Planctomycetota bacterium]